MQKIVFFLFSVFCFSSFAHSEGPFDAGAVTPDKKYILPHCGAYGFSKLTKVPACYAENLDIYRVKDLAKFSIVSGRGTEASELYGYGYINETLIFIDNFVDLHSFGKGFDNKSVELNFMKLTSLPVRDMEFMKLPYVRCWQIIAVSDSEIGLICSTEDSIDYVEVSLKYNAFKSAHMMSPQEAGVYKGYEVIPQFEYDKAGKALLITRTSEELGDGFRTFPKGKFDLVKKVFIKE